MSRTKVTLPRAVLGMVLAAGLVEAGRFVLRLVGMERGEGDAAGRPFGALRGHTYVSLTTFRESGEAVSTPVWFAISDDRCRLPVRIESSIPDAGKVVLTLTNADSSLCAPHLARR